MGRITEVVVMKGRTNNLGNYNSARFEFGMTAKLDEGEKYKEVFEYLSKEIDDLVHAEMHEHKD